MKLELSEKELLTLGKLVCLGQWVIQCDEQHQEEEAEYNQVEHKVFKALADTKYDVYTDQEEGNYIPGIVMTETCDEYIEGYSNSYFFTQLIEVLAENQLKQKLGTEQYESMDYGELIEMAEPLKKKLFKYILEQGMDKLSIM